MVASLGYFDNYLVDNHSCVIVDVEATAARLSQESVAARDMITRFTERRGSPPQTVAADTTYGNGEMLDWLEQHSITGHIPVKEPPFVNDGLYDVEQFTYRPENNTYICPEGKQLTYVGIWEFFRLMPNLLGNARRDRYGIRRIGFPSQLATTRVGHDVVRPQKVCPRCYHPAGPEVFSKGRA